jgi:type IV pilus assembly protein PilY1
VNDGGNVIRKNVVIFAGGYDPLNDFSFGTSAMGNAIYIADIETGEMIWSVSGTVGGGTLVAPDMRYSIPSDVRLIDMDGNGATDRLYVGDMGGQVWRVDLTGPLTAGTNTNVVVGKLAELSNTNVVTPVLADQRRFMFRPEVALINDSTFANGAYIAVAITSGDREDPLGETAHDRAYILRDYTLGYLPDTNNNHLADTAFDTISYAGGDLVDVTNDVVTANETALSAPSAYGWYINFKEPDPVGFVGEKGITEGQILISSNPLDPPVYTFNTYLPGINTQSSACSVSLGSNRTYFVNLLNGTGTDIIDDVTNTRSKVNESYGIASDIIIIQQEGQSTVSVGGGTADPVNTDMGDTLLPLYIIVE